MKQFSYDSISSLSFYSDNLNKEKCDILYNKAILIRDFKNELSLKISNDLLYYLDKSKFDVLKEFNTQIEGLSGQDIQHTIDDVFTAYQNKFAIINSKIKFNLIKHQIIYYKKNTKTNNKGDFNEYKITKSTSKLSIQLSFLAKYLLSEEFIRNKNDFKDEKHKHFYSDLINSIDKYGYERLINLSKLKQTNILTKYNQHSVKFESLSFTSLNQTIYPILNYNKNYNSKINSFITLSGFGLNNRSEERRV